MTTKISTFMEALTYPSIRRMRAHLQRTLSDQDLQEHTVEEDGHDYIYFDGERRAVLLTDQAVYFAQPTTRRSTGRALRVGYDEIRDLQMIDKRTIVLVRRTGEENLIRGHALARPNIDMWNAIRRRAGLAGQLSVTD